MKKTFDKRDFQLWEYRVSHGSLLVRSPKAGSYKTNLDLVFSGVEYVASPRHLISLEIDEPTPDEVRHVRECIASNVHLEYVTILVAEGRRHFVVAAGLQVSENDMGIFDSPFDMLG